MKLGMDATVISTFARGMIARKETEGELSVI